MLSGGVGARRWPVSREAYPKPFIRLADGQSLLQKTLQRASSLDGASTVVTVTNHEYVFATRDEYRSVKGALDRVFLLEPSARNTAPAIALAALYAMQRWGPDAVLLILPADHVVDQSMMTQPRSNNLWKSPRRRWPKNSLHRATTFGIPGCSASRRAPCSTICSGMRRNCTPRPNVAGRRRRNSRAGFKLKRIVVNPGAALSLQTHHHRSEHWVVIAGTAQVVNGDREFSVQANESTFIPAGNRHRLVNPGREPLVIIEVQTGDYVEEDDIVRFDDVYGRA